MQSRAVCKRLFANHTSTRPSRDGVPIRILLTSCPFKWTPGPKAGGLAIALRLRPRSLQRFDLCGQVLNRLDEHRVQPERCRFQAVRVVSVDGRAAEDVHGTEPLLGFEQILRRESGGMRTWHRPALPQVPHAAGFSAQ